MSVKKEASGRRSVQVEDRGRRDVAVFRVVIYRLGQL